MEFPCSECKRLITKEDLYQKKGKRFAYCIDCGNKYQPKPPKKRIYKYIKEYKEFLANYKLGKKCLFCPSKYRLHFHHIDPGSKTFDIGRYTVTYPIIELLIEISKCVLVCNSCHQKLHCGKLIVPGYSPLSRKRTTPTNMMSSFATSQATFALDTSDSPGTMKATRRHNMAKLPRINPDIFRGRNATIDSEGQEDYRDKVIQSIVDENPVIWGLTEIVLEDEQWTDEYKTGYLAAVCQMYDLLRTQAECDELAGE